MTAGLRDSWHTLQAGESAFKAILAPVHMGDIFGADICIRRPLAVRERLNPDVGPQPAPPTAGTNLSTATSIQTDNTSLRR